MRHPGRIPTTSLVSLLVHVYPTGELDVLYCPVSGKASPQSSAVFVSRVELANRLRELGLRDEAALIMLCDTKMDFIFYVVSTPQLVESLGLNELGGGDQKNKTTDPD
jgi:hypothetical protein